MCDSAVLNLVLGLLLHISLLQVVQGDLNFWQTPLTNTWLWYERGRALLGFKPLWVLFTFQLLLGDSQSDKKEESCKTPILWVTQQDPPETQEVVFRLLLSNAHLWVILHLLEVLDLPVGGGNLWQGGPTTPQMFLQSSGPNTERKSSSWPAPPH